MRNFQSHGPLLVAHKSRLQLKCATCLETSALELINFYSSMKVKFIDYQNKFAYKCDGSEIHWVKNGTSYWVVSFWYSYQIAFAVRWEHILLQHCQLVLCFLKLIHYTSSSFLKHTHLNHAATHQNRKPSWAPQFSPFLW